MKKILYLTAAALLPLSCVSLELAPEDFNVPEHHYNTEDEINRALTGVYDALGQQFLFTGTNKSLTCTFEYADEMFLATKNPADSPIICRYKPSDDFSNNVWSQFYKGVERANILLANLHKPEMSDEARKLVEAQTRFLRAFYYFQLVRNFGDVPLKTTPTSSPDGVYVEKTDAKEVYEFVYNEMRVAEKYLPEITSLSSNEWVSRSAAHGMMAKVCLEMAGYPYNMTDYYVDALYWAEELINSGLHSLNPDYSQVFINLIQNKYDMKESIWEVGFYTEGKMEIYKERSWLGDRMGITQTDTKYGKASGAMHVHQWHYNLYSDRDLRRDWNIAPYSFQGNKWPNKKYWTDTEIYTRHVGKYRREYELVAEKGEYTGTNFPLLRYSDVLLMAAEAENAINGPTEKAKSWFNTVRRRAFGSGKTLREIVVKDGGAGYNVATTKIVLSSPAGTQIQGLDTVKFTPVINGGVIESVTIDDYGFLFDSVPFVKVVSKSADVTSEAVLEAVLTDETEYDLTAEETASQEAFLKAIQDERSRELCFEAARRLDLKRWGILVPHMKELAAYIEETAPSGYKYAAAAGNNITEKHNYVPIPERETSVNWNIEQNELWK